MERLLALLAAVSLLLLMWSHRSPPPRVTPPRRTVDGATLARRLAALRPREADALREWLARRAVELAGRPDAAERLDADRRRLIRDPDRFMDEVGLSTLRPEELDDWLDGFVDSLWDPPLPAGVADRPVAQLRRIHRRARPAARALLSPLVGRRYASLTAKEDDLRGRLRRLRARLLAVEPAGSPELEGR